ncbi:MAG: ATP-binding protein, partial [Chloroflexota bacterium]
VVADAEQVFEERQRGLVGPVQVIKHDHQRLAAGDWADLSGLDPRVRQKQTFWAARQFVSAAASRQPLVIVLDDLHWADEASLALFEDLLSVSDDWPVLFYLIMRPLRQKGAWRLRDRAERNFHHRFSEVELAPLDEDLTRQMLARLLPGAAFPESVLDTIYAKSAGNPFYIEEIVRSLKDSGAVQLEQDEADYLGDLVSSIKRRPVEKKVKRWKSDPARLGQISVPDTLHSALIARLDRLTEDARLALQMAAVIGRQFQAGVLRSLRQARLDGAGETSLPLAQLERDNLIRPVNMEQEEYVFPDALVQEVAYENMLMQRRQQFHARIGAILEESLGERAAQECELLAHHYAASDNFERAAYYLELAGRKAQQNFSNASALEHFNRLLDLLPDDTERWARRFEVLALRQKLYGLVGKPAERQQDLEQMLALAEKYQDANRRGDVLNQLSDLFGWTGRYKEAIQAAGEALEIKRQSGDAAGLAFALHQVGLISYYQGDYAQARGPLEQAIELRRRLNDLEGETWSEMYLSMMHFMQGNYGQAIQHNRHCQQISEQRQDWFQMGIHQTNGGRILLRLGEYRAALEQLERSLEMKGRTGDRNGQGFSHYAAGLAALYLGEPDQALASFQHSFEIRQAIGDLRGAAQSLYGLGLTALKHNRPAAALDYLEQAAARHQELNLMGELIADRSAQSQAHLCQDQLPEALSASAQAMELLEQHPNVEEVQGVYLNHYRVLLAAGDPGAAAALERARQVVQQQAERIGDDALRQAFLQNVLANREILHATG